MNRKKLKAYAPQARRDFIKAVTDRAAYYGLTKNKTEPIVEKGDMAIIGGKAFPRDVVKKRKRMEDRIGRQGFEQCMEAIGYTWFNRFVAIRFMELHGYLDHGYRVLSHPEGNTIPEILDHAEHLEMPGLDREKVIELKLEGTKEYELYRMLLIAQCNALHKAMPFLFEWVDDETELLLPDNLLHSDSLIRKLVNEIPDEEWQEVEIIGWLYQFYISEKKDQVIGKVVKSEDIPAATQLFTPNWIVKYMVQNTLGRQWMATYPNSPLKDKMEYYIEPAEQTPEVQEQLKAITPESLNPEELTLLDPACGSGHILVEAYDLLKAIYQERGYRAKDIPCLILKKNLFGLEIDDRAAQLAAFALMMKARADDRRIFDNGAKPHVLAIQESKGLDAEEIARALNAPILKGELPPREMLFEEMDEAKAPLFSRKNLEVKGDISQDDVAKLIDLFEHGKTFGSLIRLPEGFAGKLSAISGRTEDVLVYGEMFGKAAAETLRPIIGQAEVISRRYSAVVTNPPYMGRKGMNGRLGTWSKDNYPDSKSDLFAMFIERNLELTPLQGSVTMITMQSWMFLSSFEKLRAGLFGQATILSMAHLGARAFDSIGGEVVSTTAFVLKNTQCPDYKGGYLRLVNGNSEAEKQASTLEAIENPNCGWFFRASAADFKKIPGSPLAYWVSENIRIIFHSNKMLGELAEPSQGMATTNNDLFLRRWFEISSTNMKLDAKTEKEALLSGKKWFPYNKGGAFRKWYGNHEFLVNYGYSGKTICDYIDNMPGVKVKSNGRVINRDKYFKPSVSWSDVTSSANAFRYYPSGFIFDTTGHSAFGHDYKWKLCLMAYCNNCFVNEIIKILNPTIHFHIGYFKILPYAELAWNESAFEYSQGSVQLAKEDWESFETSWDFANLRLLQLEYYRPLLKGTYSILRDHWLEMTLEMQRHEEENSRMFIEAYGLEKELTPTVPLKEITLTCNPHYRYGDDKSEEELESLLKADTMKELVSYATGCMMGRYCLHKPGLIYAHSGNQGFDPGQYKTFPVDPDGIIPITDTDWFDDDAANKVVEFIGVAWPREYLEENLKFVAQSLGSNRGESPRETIRRYLSTGFYKHHLSMYKKRPIYWLFSSGKLQAFQCLVYLHRYNGGTLSRMRTEYVIPLQGKISARVDQLDGDIKAATATSHQRKLQKERDKLAKQQAELQTFDEKLRQYADLRISLDLDDGVKVNYGKFGDLLAEVKAVTGEKPN